jgi:hypothetical protein
MLEVPKVFLAVLKNDVEYLQLLVEQKPAHFSFNAERRAVQISNCNAEVIASVPIPPQMVTELVTDW